jgi:hypothetical protein
MAREVSIIKYESNDAEKVRKGRSETASLGGL